jgi:hypothetical protein
MKRIKRPDSSEDQLVSIDQAEIARYTKIIADFHGQYV